MYVADHEQVPHPPQVAAADVECRTREQQEVSARHEACVAVENYIVSCRSVLRCHMGIHILGVSEIILSDFVQPPSPYLLMLVISETD